MIPQLATEKVLLELFYALAKWLGMLWLSATIAMRLLP